MPEAFRPMKPMESREVMEGLLRQAGIVDSALFEFMLQLRKICTWERTKAEWKFSCPRQIPQASLEDLKAEFLKITVETRTQLLQQIAPHRNLSKFSNAVANLHQVIALAAPPDIMVVAPESWNEEMITFGSPSGREFVVGVTLPAFPVPEQPAPPSEDMTEQPPLPDLQQRTNARTVKELTSEQLAAYLAPIFNTTETLEPEYAQLNKRMSELLNEEEYAVRFLELQDDIRAMPSQQTADLQDYCSSCPEEMERLLSPVQKKTREIAHDLFAEVTAAFPAVERLEGKRTIEEEDKRQLHSFQRCLTTLCIQMETMRPVLQAGEKAGEYEEWQMRRVTLSVLQSAFATFLQRRFPWMTAVVPSGAHEEDRLKEQAKAWNAIGTELCAMDEAVDASQLRPALIAAMAAKESFAGMRMLHDFGNIEKNGTDRPRKQITIDPARMPDMHLVHEEWLTTEDACWADKRSATSWRAGITHQLRRVTYNEGKGGGDTAVSWFERPNDEACHTPNTVIPVSAVLPRESAARTMADHMASYCDKDLSMMLWQLHPSKERDPSHIFDGLPTYMRSKAAPLVFHAMTGKLPEAVDAMDGSDALACHLILQKVHANHLGLKPTTMDLPYTESGLNDEPDVEKFAQIGPHFTIPMPDGELVPFTLEISDVNKDFFENPELREQKEQNEKERARAAMRRVYPPNKSEFNEQETRRVLKAAKIEYVKRDGAAHQQVQGPRGYNNLPMKNHIPRDWVELKIATIGDLEAFELWAAKEGS